MNEVIDWKAEAEKAEAGRLADKQRFRVAVIHETVIAEARLLGVDADIAPKIIDTEKVDVTETGEVLGAREAILDAAVRWPGILVPKVKRGPPWPRSKESQDVLDQIHREMKMK